MARKIWIVSWHKLKYDVWAFAGISAQCIKGPPVMTRPFWLDRVWSERFISMFVINDMSAYSCSFMPGVSTRLYTVWERNLKWEIETELQLPKGYWKPSQMWKKRNRFIFWLFMYFYPVQVLNLSRKRNLIWRHSWQMVAAWHQASLSSK